jgi:hypothetical protein
MRRYCRGIQLNKSKDLFICFPPREPFPAGRRLKRRFLRATPGVPDPLGGTMYPG